MLRKSRMGFPLLALVLAAAVFIAASAFADGKETISQKEVSKETVDPLLYWFDEFGNYTFRQNTKANEITPSGCPDQGTIICEKGYSKEDLLDSNHPEQGVKTGAVEDGVIMKRE